MFTTIKSKFILFSIMLIVLTITIPQFFLITQFEKNFYQRTELLLNTTMRTLKYGLTSAMMRGEQKNIQNIIDTLSAYANIKIIRIYTPTGKIKYSTVGEEKNKNISDVAPHHINNLLPENKIILYNDKKRIYSLATPIFNKDLCKTCHKQKDVIAYLDIDSDLTEAENLFQAGVDKMVYTALIVLIVLILGFYLIFHSFIHKPLQKIVGGLLEIETGNLDFKLRDNRNDEMGIVNRHFNDMVSKLKTSKAKIEELHFEQLQRGDRLKTLGELTSQMAHEINNHTGVIMTRADYLQLEASKEPLLKNYINDFDVIFKQTEKLSLITHNILEHSKMTPRDFKIVNLCQSIENVLLMIQPTCKKSNKNCVKKTNLKEALIFADPLQIEQVLINLVTNSIDAVSENGEIEIILKKTKNDEFNLTIKDNGCGIEKDKIDHIYSPFFTTKSASEGTGLGLYITKNICDNHSISISCTSRVGVGTNFTLNIKSAKSNTE